MFALSASDVGSPRRRAWWLGILSLVAAGSVAAATWRSAPEGPTTSSPRAAAIAEEGSGGRCQRARPFALLLVQVRSADLDLAHYLDADRPDGFAARVTPFADTEGRARTPHVAVAGDPRTWRWVGVHMDRSAATALASRLRQLPAIADARVRHVSY